MDKKDEKHELSVESISHDFILQHYKMNRENFRTLFKNLSIPEYIALQSIIDCSEAVGSEDGRLYLIDIAGRMNMPMPRISKMVSSLSDKGLVNWSHDSGRSGTYVSLTDSGRKLLESNETLFWDFFGRVIDKYGKEEMVELLKMMRRLDDIISNELDSTDSD